MKKRILCSQLPTKQQSVLLSSAEAHHALHVLRLRDGSVIEVIDGRGSVVLAKLKRQERCVKLEWVSTPEIAGRNSRLFQANEWPGACQELTPPLPFTFNLCIGVLKGDSMAWVVEKAVELGVSHLIPLLSEHCVVQLGHKSPEMFLQRWQKIADQSLKQCQRLERMQVSPPVAFKKWLGTLPIRLKTKTFWCDEGSQHIAPFVLDALFKRDLNDFNRFQILIGPEGGWSPAEREALQKHESLSCVKVSLGPLTLRAETAALFSVSLVGAYLQSALPKLPKTQVNLCFDSKQLAEQKSRQKSTPKSTG